MEPLKKDNKFSLIFLILQLAVIGVFLGRAWQHLYWDAPYRTLLWDQSSMEGIIQVLFGMDWDTYVTKSSADHYIASFIKGTGVFYVICALAALFIQRFPKISRPILLLGTGSLIFLAILYYMEHFYALAQFWEYSLQWGAPLLLLMLQKKQSIPSELLLLMKLGIALTFTCHGLFAVGYYPRPAYFIEMTMNILYVNEQQAILFLNIAGMLDFALSILIWLPKKIALPAVIYAAFWGLATTLARVWAYFHWAYWQETLLQWLHESVMRVPHFLIPLALALLIYKSIPSSKANTQK